MLYTHFAPTVPDQPCWHCSRFDGMTAQGSAALCTLPHAARVQALPGRGCSAFEREPGADDEPGPPAWGVEGRSVSWRPARGGARGVMSAPIAVPVAAPETKTAPWGAVIR